MKAPGMAAVAALGDAGDPATWSGIPWHYGQAARRAGWAAEPWRLDWAGFAGARRRWHLRQLFSGRRPAGYQYSADFLAAAEASVPDRLKAGRVLTFHQHFPRVTAVAAAGGELWHYLDATFASLAAGDGLETGLPAAVRAAALRLERENLQGSTRVVTMARWAADAAAAAGGIPCDRVATILPGANVELPPDFDFPVAPGWPGRDRPLVLGFVGKDWQRKGLPFLLAVHRELARRGVRAAVRCAGRMPPGLAQTAGVSFAGFIDKQRQPDDFVRFLTGCDVGCLFSAHEPLGISTLEFLRAGVPVAGFAVEGLRDTLPPDAGFRFAPGTAAGEVADALQAAFADADAVAARRAAARRWSGLVTWDRCVREWDELITTGAVSAPVQPWRAAAEIPAGEARVNP